MLYNFPFFITSYIALYALLIKTFFAFVELPVLEKFRPRYVNSLTISIAFPSYEKLICWGNRPLEKNIILDLLELTLSFPILQYSQKIFSCNCRSDAESENKTVSSAYSNTKSFE